MRPKIVYGAICALCVMVAAATVTPGTCIDGGLSVGFFDDGGCAGISCTFTTELVDGDTLTKITAEEE